MSSTPEGAASTPPPNETPSQKQARLRRERRQAKIQAEGDSRLAAITNISGRRAPAAETPQQPGALPTQQPPHDTQPSTSAPDPAEGDIAEHHYAPRTTPRFPQDAPPGRLPPGLAPQQQQQPPGPDDPMMAMLQQMLGDAPGNGGGPAPGAAAPLPPGLADLFSAAQAEDATTAPASDTAALWRIVHAVFALALAAYVAVVGAFGGARDARDVEIEGAAPSRLFVVFATGEVLLQSARFFIEKGRLPPSGVLGALSRMVPQPWAGYIRVVGRYSVIYSTLVADAMVVIFVLGVFAWWKGGSEVSL